MKKQVVLWGFYQVHNGVCKSISQQYAFLDEFDREEYELVHVTTNKTDALTKKLTKISGVEFDRTICLNENWEKVYNGSYETWGDAWDDLELSEKLTNPTHFFIMGGMYINGSYDIKKNNLPNILNKRSNMRFISIGTKILSILNMCKACKDHNAKMVEFIYDPCEANLINCDAFRPKKYHLYSFYEFRYHNVGEFVKRTDTFQYFLNRDKNVDEKPEEKIYNMTFGLTINSKHREKVYDSIKKSIDLFDNFYLSHKKLDIDTTIDRDEYLDKVKQSKYTMIVPSYNPNTFSVLRFIESVRFDTLPLIASDCNVGDFIRTFDLDRKIIDEITVEYDNITFPDEDDRAKFLDHLKEKLFPEHLVGINEMIEDE